MSDKMLNVKNRSASMVVYTIPEENIRREFMPTETKRLPYSELEKLTYQPGGRAILANFLQVQDASATQELNVHTEPEYNMSENDIKELLKTGSVDQLLDALDFAPVGVIDLIKQMAVSLPLNDFNKRKAIKEKTGFDVTEALKNVEAEKEDEEDTPTTPTAPTRRVPVETATGENTRRVAPPTYNVTSRG